MSVYHSRKRLRLEPGTSRKSARLLLPKGPKRKLPTFQRKPGKPGVKECSYGATRAGSRQKSRRGKK